MKLILFAVALTWGAWCTAAERSPVQPPANPGPPAAETPKTPDPAPSIQDPGIVKKPETTGAPGAVVTPPVVDPKMAVNPEHPQDQDKDAPAREPQAPPSPGPSR